MACNKRMIDIEKEMNNFFASDEFMELALSHDGVCCDYCNPDKFDIYDDTAIELICRAVNEKIKEFIDNATINMFIKGNGIYLNGKKYDVCIGHLIITECGFGGRKDNWIIRFDNEYVYYTYLFRSNQVLRHYRILDVKEGIVDIRREVEMGRTEESTNG